MAQVIPGMVVCGTELAELDACPRAGPAFGGIIVSGQKAALIALDMLARKQVNLSRSDKEDEPCFVKDPIHDHNSVLEASDEEEIGQTVYFGSQLSEDMTERGSTEDVIVLE